MNGDPSTSIRAVAGTGTITSDPGSSSATMLTRVVRPESTFTRASPRLQLPSTATRTWPGFTPGTVAGVRAPVSTPFTKIAAPRSLDET